MPKDKCNIENIRANIDRDFRRKNITQVIKKIKEYEPLAVLSVSRIDSNLAFSLYELIDENAVFLGEVMFGGSHPLYRDVCKAVSEMSMGDLMHINNLKVHWAKLKDIDSDFNNDLKLISRKRRHNNDMEP